MAKTKPKLTSRIAKGLRLMAGFNDDLQQYEVNNASTANLASLLTSVPSETAISSATVYASMETLASAIAQMPLEVRTTGDAKRPVVNNHPFERLWNVKPNPLLPPVNFIECLIVQMFLYGNAYVWIDRAGTQAGFRNLWLLNPGSVTVNTVSENNNSSLRTIYTVSGQSTGNYQTAPIISEGQIIRSDDMLHFRGFLNDGLIGRSIITTGARTATFLERITAAFSNVTYQTGALQQFAVTTNSKMSPDDIKTFRETFREAVGTGVDGVSEPIVIGGGAELHTLQQTMKDLELSQVREFQISDVARAFRVPGILLNQQNASTFGTGIESLKNGFLSFGLAPLFNRMESEINSKLFADSPNYAKFREDGILRGTLGERYDRYARALGGGGQPGWKTVNEVRQSEGLEILEGDDYNTPYVPPKTPQLDTNSDQNDPNKAPNE